MLNTSLIVPISPANTVTAVPVVVLLPVEVDKPVVALLLKLALVTVAVSPFRAFDQIFLNVNVALLRVFVCVHVIAVSAALIVKLLPANAVALPVHAKVAV